MCKVRWSKNITQERDTPEQIILGSIDIHLCPLLNLVINLETRGQNMGHLDFLYGRLDSEHQII